MWDSVLTEFQAQFKLDSNFLYKVQFPDVQDTTLEMRFVEDAGKKYKFKLLSRKLDTLHKIDFLDQMTP